MYIICHACISMSSLLLNVSISSYSFSTMTNVHRCKVVSITCSSIFLLLYQYTSESAAYSLYYVNDSTIYYKNNPLLPTRCRYPYFMYCIYIMTCYVMTVAPSTILTLVLTLIMSMTWSQPPRLLYTLCLSLYSSLLSPPP